MYTYRYKYISSLSKKKRYNIGAANLALNLSDLPIVRSNSFISIRPLHLRNKQNAFEYYIATLLTSFTAGDFRRCKMDKNNPKEKKTNAMLHS